MSKNVSQESPKSNIHVIAAVDWNPSKPFAVVVKKGRSVTRILSQHGLPVDAGYAAMTAAAKAKTDIRMEGYLADSIQMQMRAAGVNKYREGLTILSCLNRYEAEGYETAHADDAGPLFLRGWPIETEEARYPDMERLHGVVRQTVKEVYA